MKIHKVMKRCGSKIEIVTLVLSNLVMSIIISMMNHAYACSISTIEHNSKFYFAKFE